MLGTSQTEEGPCCNYPHRPENPRTKDQLDGIAMDNPVGWARANAAGIATMRRGAWYPLLDGRVPNRLFVHVGPRTVVVHRDLVEVREVWPDRFSVVLRTPEDRNPAAGTGRDLGLRYAVCPWSRCRVKIRGHPSHLECPQCHHWAEVDWTGSC